MPNALYLQTAVSYFHLSTYGFDTFRSRDFSGIDGIVFVIDEGHCACECAFWCEFFFRDFKSAGHAEHFRWFVLGGIRVCRYILCYFSASKCPFYAHMVWVEAFSQTHKSDLFLTARLIYNSYIWCCDVNTRICKTI